MQNLLTSHAVMAKLAVNRPGDSFEQEADRVADAVMRGGGATAALNAPPLIQRACGKCGSLRELDAGRRVQRKCAECEEEEAHVQLKANSAGPAEATAAAPPPQVLGAQAAGHPLAEPLRSNFEQRFGHDFNQVRVHTGAAADASARSLNAVAYTVGRDIVFGAGRYSPSSAEGQRLIAHELTHFIQQRQGAPLQIQRQEIEDLPRVSTQRQGPGAAPPNAPAPTPTTPILRQPEPRCPSGGTNIGNLLPQPPCEGSDEIVDGPTFEFCRDSDVFKDPAHRTAISTFARQQRSLARFQVQAWASLEGPGTPQQAVTYNENLSCHRAKRVARELVNAGVREERIEIAAMGPTDRFDAGTSEASRARNRVVVLHAEAPAGQTDVLPQPATLRQIANIAKARLERGEYLLGADAYVARWTCGRFHSLADIVRRTTIQVEGEDFTTDITNRQIPFDEGTIGLVGQHVIRLSSDIPLTSNAIECAMNRIADLAFHHFARPHIPNFDEQHQGAMHMLSLGGFGPCRMDLGIPGQRTTFLVPSPGDPKSGLQPPCADAALAGALNPQRHVGGPAAATTFTGSINVAANSGTLTQVNQGPFVDMDPNDGIRASGQVTAAGDPAEIRRFDVGFVQTVMEEDQVITFVNGSRLRANFPLPLRDGPRSTNAMHDPPWFDSNSRVTAQPGTFTVRMEDFPNFRVPSRFIDLSRSSFVARRSFPRPPGGPSVPLAEDRPDLSLRPEIFNPPDKAHRQLLFTTWLVARRNTPPAPVSRFSSEFITGQRITFRIDADFILRSQTGLGGRGSWSVSSANAPAGDQDSVQFRGATPADFFAPGANLPLMAEFTAADPPLARTGAGGLDVLSYLRAVTNIAAGPRQARGLTGPLRVIVKIDLATGRVIIDDLFLTRASIRVLPGGGTTAPAPALLELAKDIFPEVRKLVLGRVSGVPDTQTGVFNLPLVLS